MWAYLELSLDQTVAIIYHKYGGNKIDKEIPASLKRKVNFLKSSLRKRAELAPFKDDGIAILLRVTSLKQERHSAIHGALLRSREINKYLFTSCEYEPTIHKTKERHISIQDLLQIGDEIKNLSLDSASFAKLLLDNVLRRK